MQVSFKQLTKILVLILVLVIISGSLIATISNAPNSKQARTIAGSISDIPSSAKTSKLPVGENVDPFSAYSTEPAPMGIADYGINAYGQTYNYVTSSFQGIVQINSLSTYNSSQHSSDMTFQLNVNMNFYDNNALYVYWIQDVAYLNTSTGQITILDNIWNLSSSGASMYNSTVLGNGTVNKSGSSLFYYSVASSALPGNGIYLNSTPTIFLRTNTFNNSNNFPEVDFLYNDGYGWVTYDNAEFIFATHLQTTPHFVVDGSTYEPNGYSFYDAELILGGPGGGSQTMDLNSNVSLVLEYYNGNNFQIVSNAYNFGSDTAEGIFNSISAAYYYIKDGQLFVNVSNGNGGLGSLYSISQVSSLEIKSNINSGDIFIGGTNVTYFTGGLVNVTLSPGTYYVSIYDTKTGTYAVIGNISLSAGVHYSILKSIYHVKFSETGLSPGTIWYVNITGQPSSGKITGNFYTADLPNNTYTFNISTGNKDYYPALSSGNFVVNGNNVTESIEFVLRTYVVTFSEVGLPNGAIWYVNLTNGATSGPIIGNSTVFNLPNGSYYCVIGTNDKIYSSSPKSFNVTGTNKTFELVTFYKVVYKITFVESGLPSGTTWYLNFSNGTSYKISSTSVYYELPNGTYNYSVASSSDLYKNATNTSYLTVAGTAKTVSVEFIPSNGFLTGTIKTPDASISINGIVYSVTFPLFNGQFNFSLPPGSYEVKVTAPGYLTYTTNITVSSAHVTTIPIQQLNKKQSPLVSVLVLVIVIIFIVAAFVFLRTRGRLNR